MLPNLSMGFRPLVYLPVGPVGKSIPYGKKFAFDNVGRLLLFPLSAKESPKTKRQGTAWEFPRTLCCMQATMRTRERTNHALISQAISHSQGKRSIKEFNNCI